MRSPDTLFDELRTRLAEGGGLRPTGDDPVYYLVFEPSQMRAVRRALKQWRAKLDLEGWTVGVVSVAEILNDVLREHPRRTMWERFEKPLDFEAHRQTISSALGNGDVVKARLREAAEELRGDTRPLLFVADVEALHPYLRVGTVEQGLQGELHVPTVVLYPGRRVGESPLRFLGFYEPYTDYRATIIGG